MTVAEYKKKKAQIAVLDELLTEFRGNTSLNTMRHTLFAEIQTFEDY